MRLLYRLAWTIAVLPVFCAKPAAAESLVVWETSLERAAQTAAQSNRLVLVHFSASWCAPCKWMDAEVFSRPEVAAHIQVNYVAVKLDVDQNQDLVKKYGVAGLPTDLILTPRGEVVSMVQGRADSGQYVARLNQVASKFRQPNAAMLVSVPGGPSLPNANPPSMTPSPANPANAANPALATMPSDPASNGAAAPQFVPPNPAYGQSLTLNGPVNGTNSPGMTTPQPTAPQMPPGSPVAPNGAFAAGGAPGGNPNIDNAVAMLTQPPPASAGTLPPYAPAPPMNPPPNPAPNKPLVNPPVALDGYCPVSLTERHKWVPGDKRWGAYHQGRTYLFAGPEEQAKFLANSNYDRYAPVASGLDIVVAAEEHRDVAGKREHGVFYKDRVILFASEASVQKFYSNPNYYIRLAMGAPMAAAPGQQPR